MSTVVSFLVLLAAVLLPAGKRAITHEEVYQMARTGRPVVRPDGQAGLPGAPIRTAEKTGHVSNYDETKVGTYTLPDPLMFASGKPVKDAAAWTKERRAELIKIYERDIWGRIPENT